MHRVKAAIGLALIALIGALLLEQLPSWAAAIAFAGEAPVDDYSDQKDLGGSLPDPNRPYYDQYGNEYSYQGNPIPPAPQPETGK